MGGRLGQAGGELREGVLSAGARLQTDPTGSPGAPSVHPAGSVGAGAGFVCLGRAVAAVGRGSITSCVRCSCVRCSCAQRPVLRRGGGCERERAHARSTAGLGEGVRRASRASCTASVIISIAGMETTINKEDFLYSMWEFHLHWGECEEPHVVSHRVLRTVKAEGPGGEESSAGQ